MSAYRPDAGERHRAIQRTLAIVLACNLAVAAIKAIYGWLSGSLAIATDAVHSLLDGSANIAGLVVLRYAAAPPDKGHPYGHYKLEILAATGLGIAIGYLALRFGYTAVSALVHGAPPLQTSLSGFMLMGLTLVVNLFVTVYETRRGRALNSPYLVADAAHTASDVGVTIAVLGSFTAAHLGIAWADPIGALAVIVVIARVAWKILADNLSILMDRAVLDTAEIERIVLAVPGVRGCHRIRSRGAGNAVMVDLHLLLRSDIPLHHAHDLAHRVERELRAELPMLVEVLIHMEPEDDMDTAGDGLADEH